MTASPPRQFSDPWTEEQVLAGAERMDMTQVMRLLRLHSCDWSADLMSRFVDRSLPRLRAAHRFVPQDEHLVSLWLGAYLVNPLEGPSLIERFCRSDQDLDLMSLMVGSDLLAYSNAETKL